MSLIGSLKQRGQIWSGDDLRLSNLQATSTGLAKLDHHLPGKGWPLGAVTEIFYTQLGQGEVRLVMPFLNKLKQEDQRWQVWLNPPQSLNGPSLAHWGMEPSNTLICFAEKESDQLWTLEQSITSGGSSTVLAWVNKLEKSQLRRIQLAAEKNRMSVFLFRPEKMIASPSVAALRILVNQVDSEQVSIDIKKRKNGWPVEGIKVPLSLQFQKKVIRSSILNFKVKSS